MKANKNNHRGGDRWQTGRPASRCLRGIGILLIAGLLAVLPAFQASAGAPDKDADGSRGKAGALAPWADAKLSAPLKNRAISGTDDPVDVIITYRARPGRGESDRIKALGGSRDREFRNFRMLSARLPERALNALANNPNIEFISRDAPIVGASVAARQTARLPNDQDINLYYTGWGLGVAVIDSGLGSHIDIWPSPLQFDFIKDPVYPPSGLGDGYGHGTHVAGIIGGDGYYSQKTYRGVAPYADIISLRVLDNEGKGVSSDLLAALDWLIDNAAAYNIRVVNMSLGKGPEEPAAQDPLVQAAEAVWDAGIVVVCSAGNYGQHGNFTISSPGTSRKVITVGSLTDSGTGTDFTDDYVSTYSSRGPTAYDHFLKPDLLAPGNRWIAPIAYEAALKTQLPDRVVGNVYLELSGTSMAAPMVAGTAALMIHQEPTLNPATVKARLMRSARKINEDPAASGAGVLDIEAALAETGSVTQAPSPKLVRHDEANVILIEDTAELWGDTQWSAGFLWADGFMWADGFTSADGFLWADGFMWADTHLWSDGLLWADGFMWADGLLWADGFMWADHVLEPVSLVSLSSGGDDANSSATEQQTFDSNPDR